MNRISAVVFGALLTLVGGAAYADTTVGGALVDTNTVWTVAGSPYIMNSDVVVQVGQTLTIEPGVVVRATDGETRDIELIVRGTLVAAGTEVLPIMFESATLTTAGAWEGIRAEAGAALTIRNVSIAHADYPIEVATPNAATQVFENITMTTFATRGFNLTAPSAGGAVLSNVDITCASTSGTGVYSDRVGIDWSGGTVKGCGDGLLINNATVDVDHVVFDTNTDAIDVRVNVVASYGLNVDYCTFWGNGDGIEMSRASSTSYVLSTSIRRSIFGENGAIARDISSSSYRMTIGTFSRVVWWGTTNFVGLASNPTESEVLRYNALLANPAAGDFEPTDRSPARYFGPSTPALTVGAIPHDGAATGAGIHGFHYVNRTFSSGSSVDVAGDVVIAPGVSFGFQPNVTLRMTTTDNMTGGVNTGKIEIRVEGTLEGDGTTNFPIRFTSAATTPARGDWYGLIIPQNNQAYAIANVDIGHAIRGITLESSTRRVLFSTIHDCSQYGIYITGGTPDVQFTDLNDNAQGLYALNAADVTMTDVDIRRSTNYGARFENANVSWVTGRVHDNGTRGIEAYLDQVASYGVALRSLTIANNAGAGVFYSRPSSTSYNLTVNLTDSAVTHNGSNGIQEGSSSSYRINLGCSGTNSWGNTGSNYNIPNSPNPPTNCVSWNPLYVDLEARDYRPTSRSPHRKLGNSAGLIGALAYAGDQTLPLMGFAWDGLTLTEDASPHSLVGDLYVPAGATLTLESGAEIRVANTDGMGGGLITNRTEVRVLQGGILASPAAAPRARFLSAVSPAVYGSWYGFRFDNSTGFTVRNIETQHAQYGAFLEGPAAPPFEDFRSIRHSNFGIYGNDVQTGFGVDLLGVELIGPGSGTGISLQDSNARIRSSYITHHNYGLDAYLDQVTTRTVYAVNNTFVGHTDGIRYGRASSTSYDLRMRINNNVVSANTSAAVRDYSSSSYSVDDQLTYNNFFGVATLSLTANSATGNITSDPRIEDNDWDADPRWWDGKLWANSLAINAGSAGVAQYPTRDVIGKSRSLGSGPDMGAWEYDATANQEPRADSVGGNTMAPTGELFTYDGTSAFDPDGSIAAAYWTFSDGTVLAGQTVQHTFATAGSRWAYITVVDDDGAEDHALLNVNVNTRPIAEAGPPLFQDEAPGGSGEFVAPAESSSDPDGSVVSWVWNWGDGTTNSTGRAPTHQYTAAGVYLITLTVTDNEGLTHTDTTTATVLTSDTSDTVGPLIIHTEIADGRPLGSSVAVNANIQDTSTVASAFVQYRRIGSTPVSFATMSRVSGDNWTATIPSAAIQAPGMEYWIIAFDGADPQNQTVSPLNAPAADVYDFLVSGDPDAPVITHTEIADNRPPSTAVSISATITDATGVGSANLYFGALGSTSFGAVPMTRVTGDLWSAQIPAYIVAAPGVRYYIEATDTSPVPNRGVAPSGAPTTTWDFTVGTGDNAAPLIAHTAPAGPLSAGNSVTLTAGVVDSGGAGTSSGIASVTLRYRTTGGGAFTPIVMTLVSGSTYTATIPGAGVITPGLEYYIEAADVAGNVGRSPDGVTFHSVVVSNIDVTGPTITHTPVTDGQPDATNVTVNATVTDTSGLSQVRLFYRPSGYPFYSEVSMTAGGAGAYSAAIPGFAVAPPYVDYYIRATDTASNASTSPAGAPTNAHRFTVGSADSTGPTIVHAAIPNGQDVGENVVIDAVIFDTSNVSAATLHYRRIGQPSFATLAMTRGTGDNYAATIPAGSVTTDGVEYYISATDSSPGANVSRSPSTAPTTNYTFTAVVVDVTPPTVSIGAVPAQIAGTAFVVSATASDTVSAINSVTLRYRTQGTVPFTDLAMTWTGANWTATVPSGAVVVPGVELQAVALDAAGNSGTSSLVAVTVTAPADVAAPVIVITTVANGRLSGTAVTVSASITDASGVASATLWHRPTGSGVYSQVAMTAAGDTWSGTIPAGSVNVPGVQYYVTAIDSAPAANTATAPATAPGTPLSFTVVSSDVAGPVITHTAPTGPLTSGANQLISATITDASTIASATLYWRTAGGTSWTSQALTLSGGQYSATIGPVVAPSLQYYFFAIDSIGNSTTFPVAAPGTPVSVTVVDPDVAGPVITHTPVANGRTAGAAVVVNATATDATGVAGLSLLYRTVGAPSFTETAMTNTGGTWSASIPAGTVTAAGVQYYLRALDTLGNATVAPSTAPGTPYSFTTIVVDVDAPLVGLTPPGAQTEGVAFDVSITASDAISSIASVTLRYRAQGTTVFANVAATGTGPYTARVPAGAVVAPGIEIQAVATDSAGNVGQTTVTLVTVNPPPDVTGPTITLSPVADGQLAGSPVLVTATINDASGVLNATLYHRVLGAGSWSTVAMTRGGASWTASIPGDAVTAPGVQYYVSAVDAAVGANVSVAPATAPTTPAQFTVTTLDTAGPSITHTPRTSILVGSTLDVGAVVNDTSGVASVSVFWRTTGTAVYTEVAMVNVAGTYGASIGPVAEPGIQYYFRATDTVGNVSLQPIGAPYSVLAEVPDLAGPTIVHIPIAGDHAPSSTQVVSATVTDASAVVTARLYYRSIGAATWNELAMTSAGDVWSRTIPSAAVVAPGVEYYISATDGAAAANVSYAPTAAPTAFYSFTVSAVDASGPGIVADDVPSPQLAGEVVEIVATITDRSGVDTATVFVDSPADPESTVLVEMVRGAGDTWSAVIAAELVVVGEVFWFIEAVDMLGNVSYAPAAAPTDRYAFDVEEPVGEDELAPIIVHTAITEAPRGVALDVSAIISDASGVASAALYFREPGDLDWLRAAMTGAADDNWIGRIPTSVMRGDSVEYYIEAVDGAAAANLGTDPDDAPTTVYTIVTIVEGADTGTDTSDASDTSDSSDTSDAGDTSGDATDVSDTGDVTDASDTSDTTDTADSGADVSDVGGDVDPDAGGDTGADAGDAGGDSADVSLDGSGEEVGDDTGGTAGGSSRGGGCSASPTPSSTLVWLGVAVVGVVYTRRRRLALAA
jgi:hypothetical protein